MIAFSIKNWGGWAPCLEQPEQWKQWANGDLAIGLEGMPAALAIPPLLRRRASRQLRMAFEAADQCCANKAGIPVVFCSRHGEVRRSLEILEPLMQNEPVSPATFSLSVHNAIGGIYSIALQDSAPVTALAAGADTAAHGIVEACGQLADGAGEVLVVAYDEPLPESYRQYRDEAEASYAWAWLITPPQDRVYQLSWDAAPQAGGEADEPFGLRLMRCFLSDASDAILPGPDRTWRWKRHA